MDVLTKFLGGMCDIRKFYGNHWSGSMFNYKHLAVAIASISAVGVANAAGLDRSGQDLLRYHVVHKGAVVTDE